MFKHILGSALGAMHHMGRTSYPKGWKRVGRGGYTPHQGKCEIERRLKQAERDRQRQTERGFFEPLSRRGRVML